MYEQGTKITQKFQTGYNDEQRGKTAEKSVGAGGYRRDARTQIPSESGMGEQGPQRTDQQPHRPQHPRGGRERIQRNSNLLTEMAVYYNNILCVSSRELCGGGIVTYANLNKMITRKKVTVLNRS